MGVGLKPLRTGQTPSEYSRKEIGASAIADHRQTSSLTPNLVPRLAGRSSGAPMSPMSGIARGTSPDGYIRVPSDRALRAAMTPGPSRKVQSRTARNDARR
jgi:hypothetical protein